MRRETKISDNEFMTQAATNVNSNTWHRAIGHAWRKHVRPWWTQYKWVVLGGLGAAALGLGYVGFRNDAAEAGEDRTHWDNFYLALRLFILECDPSARPIRWELQVARLLAPAVTVYTAAEAVAAICHEQLQWLRLRFVSQHVVLCGLGRKGMRLAKAFHEQGYTVVAIEEEEDHAKQLDYFMQRRATVLIGCATDRDLLRKAKVERAKYLVAVCGDDGTNAEIAVHARELVADRTASPLTCFVHIANLELCRLLREQTVGAQQVDSFRLELFNVFESGARAVLNRYPAFSEADEPRDTAPHLVVVGLGLMGESLVVQAARSWWGNHRASSMRLTVTVVDAAAPERCRSLLAQHPALTKVCELVPRPMAIAGKEFQQADWLFDSTGRCVPTAVYVCVDDDSAGLTAGLALLQRLRGRGVPIVIQMAEDAGLATLLRGEAVNQRMFEDLNAFGLLDQTCTLQLLVNSMNETLAVAYHEQYCREQAKCGKTPESNPSMVPWEKLPDPLRESNRRQADHIGMKLKEVGCAVAPLTDWDADLFAFSPEEVERMAVLEHDRWCAALRREGWTYEPGPKDYDAKTNPYLVSWSKLPDDVKEWNRAAIRDLPRFVTLAGFQIHRVK